MPLEPDDEPENLEENKGPANQDADYVQDFKTFLANKAGSFSALNVSFENSSQILELASPSCSVTPLLIDYGLDASNPYDINAVSSVSKLVDKLRRMRPSIVLYNLLGVDKKNMKQVLQDISKELPNRLLRHQIRLHGLLPWRRLSSTLTSPRHMDEYMLDWVMSRTFSFGRIWANIILHSGWTTLKRRPPTTHLT